MKNLIPFTVDDSADFPDAGSVETAIEANAFSPCGPHDRERRGWVPVYPDGPRSFESLNAQLLRFRLEKRTVSAALVRERLEQRVREIEREEGRVPGRKEKAEIKEMITDQLLPQVLPTARDTWVLIDRVSGRVLVDATSRKAAETVLTELRKACGSLPVVPPNQTGAIARQLTEWLRIQEVPAGFGLGGFVHLVEPVQGGASARLDREDLFSDEVSRHIESGKLVRRLALQNEAFSFRLDTDWMVLSLKYSDAVAESIAENDDDSAAARFDHEMGVLILEWRNLLAALEEALPA